MGEVTGDTAAQPKGIEALILDNLEEGKSRERIVEKLIKRFSLKEYEANAYYEKYAKETLE